MSVPTKNFSDFTKRYAGLVGIPWDNQNTSEQEFAKGYFQTAIQDGWESNSFLDLCPYGEARFISNLVQYPTKLANPVWTATGVTAANDSSANPMDGFITASALRETATTGVHRIEEALSGIIGATSYSFSCFARSVNRQYLYLTITNGALTAQAVFNLTAGTVATPTGTLTNLTANISQSAAGFYFCELNFTTASAFASSSTLYVGLSDGTANLQYTGDSTYGADVWGVCVTPSSNMGTQNSLLSFQQPGFDEIGTVIEAWWQSPVGYLNPVRCGYQLTRDGIQFINSGPFLFYPYWGFPIPATGNVTNLVIPNIVFISYRKSVPDYSGDDYSVSSAYAIGEQVLFEDSDNVSNYYKCVAATTAGQSPESAPTYWEVILIPNVIFVSSVYSAYAAWLLQDGQMEKSLAMDARSQLELDKQSDVQERQMGLVPPMKVATHVTSQPRY